MKALLRSIPASLIVLARPALAHEGHGDPRWTSSLMHYLLEPGHLAVVLLASVAVGLTLRWARRSRKQKPSLSGR